MSDLGVDSLSLMDLLSLIEKSLGTTIPDEDLPKITTIDELVDYVTTAAAPSPY